MDIREKVIAALTTALKTEYIRLEDDDGISGFIVSSQFNGLSTWDRQILIEEALTKSTHPLAPDELRQVLMIAGLTPAEYEEVGARILVSKIEELDGGGLEVLVQGGPSDAKYVRGALNNEKGVKTDEPTQISAGAGVLMSFHATGTESVPLTKAKAVHLLESDPYIAVMPGA